MSTKGIYAFEKLGQKQQTKEAKKRDSKSTSQAEDNGED
jgi:hypothetical protein